MIVVCQCNFTFVSFSSYSCGYRKVFEEYVGILRQKYPELQIEGENYNPPGYNMLIAKILVRIIVSSSVILTFHHRRHNNVFSQGLAKISLIVFIVSGFDRSGTTTTIPLAVVYRQSILFVYHDIFYLQRNRGTTHIVRSF